MDTYYIYMIEIEGVKNKDKKYYVGKSHQLEVRLNNHISRNCKSVKALREAYKVIAIREIHEIQGINCSEITAEVDSITSRLENRFVTEKIKDDKEKKSQYSGGNYVCDLKSKRYCEELKGYNLDKVTHIEYEVTEDNKDEIVKKVMSDINKSSEVGISDNTL